jgi:hypothetical protein
VRCLQVNRPWKVVFIAFSDVPDHRQQRIFNVTVTSPDRHKQSSAGRNLVGDTPIRDGLSRESFKRSTLAKIVARPLQTSD